MQKLILKSRWGKELTFDIKENLEKTLYDAYDYVVKEDYPGFFFNKEDANQDWIKEENWLIFTNSYGEEVGAVDYKIVEG